MKAFLILLLFVIPSYSYAQTTLDDTDEVAKELREIKELIKLVNTNNTALFWSSFIIGITIAVIAFVGTIINAHELSKQVKMTSHELTHRLRPILSRDEKISIVLPSKSEPDIVQGIGISIKNVGLIVATNVIRKSRFAILPKDENDLMNINTPTKQPYQKFKQMNIPFKTSNLFSLSPTESIYTNIKVNNEELKEILHGNKFCFEIVLTYSGPDKDRIYVNSIVAIFKNGVVEIHNTEIT